MDHLEKQIDSCLVEVLAEFLDVLLCVDLPLGEGHLHLGQIFKALPGLLGRCAQCLENLEDLPNFGVTLEEGFLMGQFEEDDAN